MYIYINKMPWYGASTSLTISPHGLQALMLNKRVPENSSSPLYCLIPLHGIPEPSCTHHNASLPNCLNPLWIALIAPAS